MLKNRLQLSEISTVSRKDKVSGLVKILMSKVNKNYLPEGHPVHFVGSDNAGENYLSIWKNIA